MCSLQSDVALGHGMHPKTLEDVIHVLTTHVVKHGKMTDKCKTMDDDNGIPLSFHQKQAQLKCWQCSKAGHIKKDFPELKKGAELNLSWAG